MILLIFIVGAGAGAGGGFANRWRQSQLEATKTVGVLLDGKTRLESGLNEVMNAYR